jgi:hypothetical protein
LHKQCKNNLKNKGITKEITTNKQPINSRITAQKQNKKPVIKSLKN